MEPTHHTVPSYWRAGDMGNGVRSLNLHPGHVSGQADLLALVDAGIAVGSFGYGLSDTRDAAQFSLVPDDAPQAHDAALDALAHEQAELAHSRKSKLALFRGEADGSVRGLRNAAISLGYLPDHGTAEDGDDSAAAGLDQGGYGESWRIGWTERLPEIMQLSVDGPLEDMGLETSGHVPRAAVPDPLAPTGSGTPALSEQAQDLLSHFLDDAAEAPECFDFVSHAPSWDRDAQAAGGPANAAADHMAEEVHFIESQYAALHGALFDGDQPVHLDLQPDDPHHAGTAHGTAWHDWLHSGSGDGFA